MASKYHLSSDLRPARKTEDVSVYGPWLHTVYPCCGGDAKFRTVNEIPRESYVRICPRCDTRWEVVRRIIALVAHRVDALDWSTPRVEIHARNRKQLLRDVEG